MRTAEGEECISPVHGVSDNQTADLHVHLLSMTGSWTFSMGISSSVSSPKKRNNHLKNFLRIMLDPAGDLFYCRISMIIILVIQMHS